MKCIFAFLLSLFQYELLLAREIDISSKSIEWRACKYDGVTDYNQFNTNTETCYKAVVPGTVLSTLLANNHFRFSSNSSDIYFESNLDEVPDIYANTSLYKYWFIAEFSSNIVNEDRVFLNFRGINYRASISLNEKELSKSTDLAGMFQRRSFDITDMLIRSNDQSKESLNNYQRTDKETQKKDKNQRKNRLVVLVEPPDYVGEANVGQGGDHEIARNGAIMQFLGGWDWIRGN